MKLGELLLKNQLLSANQLEQGLQAQKLYGGKLGSNLVELGILSELQLTELLSQQLSIPAAKPSHFDSIGDDIISLMSGDFAFKHRVVPIGKVKNRLRVAFADPLDFASRQEVEFSLGQTIEPLVAPEMLIFYGLGRYYDIPSPRRGLKWDDTDEDQLQHLLVPTNANFLDIDELDQEIAKKSVGIDTYQPEDISQELYYADSKEDIFRALFRFLDVYFGPIAVLVNRQRAIWGWRQKGFNCSLQDLRKQLLQPTDSGSIAQTFTDCDAKLSMILSDREDLKILNLLGADKNARYSLLPLPLNGSVAALFITGNDLETEPQKLQQQLGAIQAALLKGSTALQILRLKRRLLKP